MSFFIHHYFLSLLIIVFFGFAGFGFFSFLLSNQNFTLTQRILIAPSCGLVIAVLGIIFLYTIGLNFISAVIVTIAPLSILSIYFLIGEVKYIKLLVVLPFIVVTFLTSLLCNSNAIKEKEASIQMIDGSDAMGYSINADWLCFHTIKEPPLIKDANPYEVLPYQNLRTDQRLGSFIYLALISKLEQQASLFSYNSAVSIALAIFFIGLAAVISSRWITIFLIIGLLFFSQLIDLANAGYLGKILGYPANLLILALCLKSRSIDLKNVLCYCIIAVGASSLYSYISTYAIFFFAALLLFLYNVCVERKNPFIVTNNDVEDGLIYLLGVIALLGFSTSGGFLVMLADDFIHGWLRGPLVASTMQITLKELGFLLLNIDYYPSLLRCGSYINFIMGFLTGLAFLIIIIASMIIKNKTAFILVILPLVVSFILLITGRYWACFQLSALTYVSATLAFGVIINELLKRNTIKIKWLAALCITIFTIPHLPRFFSIIDRFVYSSPAYVRYTEEEFKKMETIVGMKKVMIDTISVYDTQPLLLEFGRNKINMFFTPRAWILTGWGLSYKDYCSFNEGDDCSFRILPIAENCEWPWIPVYQGRHYLLTKNSLK